VSQTVQPAINASTRLCAVIGSPIRHSASPAMHNAAFAELGLNWRYLAFEVAPENLRAAIEGAKALGIAGLNLTVPHKLLTMEIVDVLDESAKVWGAVNTIRFEGRSAKSDWQPLRFFEKESPIEIRSVGFNTDADGLANSLREDLKFELNGKRVLLLGAGGAGRSIALKLAAEGTAELFLVNRTFSKTLEIQAAIQKNFPSVYVGLDYPHTEADLIVNATSLGLNSDDTSPLNEAVFPLKSSHAVYDIIYRPAETKFLADAKKVGCKTANGLGMLLHQGAQAFEIWTGKTAPLDVMRRALEENIYGH
jgi:shikimate dehydrogenase